MSDNKGLSFKILFLGDSSVGKTCFLMRFTKNTFQDIHLSTIGIESEVKEIALDDGRKVKLHLCDTAGEEKFRAITRSYYKGANGIILFYDITKESTFKNIKNWIKQIKDEGPGNIVTILIGNKIDLEEFREVSTEDGQKFAKDYDIQFFESSAKNGTNVKECFDQLIKSLLEKKFDGKEGIKLDNSGNNTKKKCC